METIDAMGAVAMPFDTRNAPQPPAQPMLNVPPVVLALVAVLVAGHLLFWVLGPDWQTWAQQVFWFIPVRLGGGPPIPFPQGAQVWTFFTYALFHADRYHLASNCVWLLIFSTPVARRLGAMRYLLLIAGSVAAGAAAMLVTHWGENIGVLGASAAVSATLAAAMPVIFAPGFSMGATHLVDYQKLKVPGPLRLLRNGKALVFAGVFVAMTLLTGASMALTSVAFLEERPIAWEAHLGGFIAGLILFYLLDKKPFRN
jgi:membrane associated rhomboid family serine protease